MNPITQGFLLGGPVTQGVFAVPRASAVRVLSASVSVTEVHEGDVGVAFAFTATEGTAARDLSGAAVKRFLFQKPDGTVLTVDAGFGSDGTDGTLVYVTRDGDLDQTGTWRYQVYFEDGAEAKHSSVGKFKVFPNLPIG